MPDPEAWYKFPNHKEYFIYLYAKGRNELRIRIRYELTPIYPRSKKKEVNIFSVGLEVFRKDKWRVIIRHCNFHEPRDKFHTHNIRRLPSLGKTKKLNRKFSKRKSPKTQLTWSINEIKLNYRRYLREYLEKYKNI